MKSVSFMKNQIVPRDYRQFLADIQQLLRQARRAAARSVNAVMTATYWEIGRRIVVYEQKGEKRADYGEELLLKLSSDLTGNLGRGFSKRNLEQMRLFYLFWPLKGISGTLSRKLPGLLVPEIAQTLSAQLDFPLSWSHYSRLLRVKNPQARAFYEAECLRGGWSVRQMERQIDSQYYERTALSRNKAAMLTKGSRAMAGDAVTPEEGLIRHLESFLMELGGHFTHADAGQML